MPEPEPGLVIPYAYLWRHERRQGLEEGRKVRPAVIVLAVRKPEGGATRVTVAPITHSPPSGSGTAIEMPARVKQSLRLDQERSWIVLDEVNAFDWPGYDIRPVSRRPERFHYGFIPPKLFDQVIGGILALAAERKVAEVRRD